jgi:hypothetical protein
MENPQSNTVADGAKQSRRLMRITASLVVVAMVGVAMLALNFGASQKGALAGGKPYPLVELLTYIVPRPLPAHFQAVEAHAIAKIPKVNEIVKTLDSQGVSVSYVGSPIDNQQLAASESVCLKAAIELVSSNAFAQNLDPTTAIAELESSSYCLDQAVSINVMRRAAIDAALKGSSPATLAQAKSFAEQQLAHFEAEVGTPNAIVLPAGETLQDVTTCAACIAGYQDDLNFEQEISSITKSATNPTAQNAAITNWFSGVLQNGPALSLTNVPNAISGNLPSYLPQGLSGNA